MTKYVVNSGNVHNNPDKAKKFYTEVLKGLGNKPKVLFCLFATPREYWEQKFEKYKNMFLELIPQKAKPIIEMALPSTFENQVKQCDVIIIPGGDDHLLQHWLKRFDLLKIWDGKVVATSSASSDLVSTHFWTCDWRQCMDGLSILPIKFIPHYKSFYGSDDPRGPIDWDKAYKELEEYGDKSLPIHALEEGDHIVFEK